jgi:hypothetical protein
LHAVERLGGEAEETSVMTVDQARRFFFRGLVAAGLAASCGAPAMAADAVDEDAATAAWQADIARVPAPAEGCHVAEFPSRQWTAVACTVAPARPYVPRTGALRGDVVGDGHDYGAGVSGLMSSATGSFPHVKVKSETDGGANFYTLQLNSNFMKTAVCDGHPACLSWMQFVYSSGEEAAFMQTWLIHWNATCPGGWFEFYNDCYRNSAAVSVPLESVRKLKKMQVNGTAAASGNDVLVFTVGRQAYRTQGPDSVVNLASGWNSSEFNVIGDGGGGQARFGAHTSMTVKIQVDNGTSDTPTCQTDAGTTGETNNLNLGSCTAVGGSAPYIEFTQSN